MLIVIHVSKFFLEEFLWKLTKPRRTGIVITKLKSNEIRKISDIFHPFLNLKILFQAIYLQ